MIKILRNHINTNTRKPAKSNQKEKINKTTEQLITPQTNILGMLAKHIYIFLSKRKEYVIKFACIMIPYTIGNEAPSINDPVKQLRLKIFPNYQVDKFCKQAHLTIN
eukprot:TRINITY_DN2277_c1_g1_i1.p1 TRINITY_DN2277_c1_g1~~TRINITY_DN2277_c1_g1_i1.p1  ORF type:complete len:107 (+),score=0.36 TRINITY_DN2277_c1_g1_i1:248-568(+)